MAKVPPDAQRLLKPFEVGIQIARGRRLAKISQAEFAQKLGVSRKTVSDLERGASEHVSLKTAMAAMALAGFVLYSAERRPPTMDEIMANRAADRARADALLNTSTPAPTLPKSPAILPRSRRRRGSV